MTDLVHLHPMIVHFPIALLIVGFLADLAAIILKREFFQHAGLLLLVLGTLGVAAAYISGNLAGNGLTEAGPLKQALERHEDAALVTLWLMSLAALVRIAAIGLKQYRGIFRWAALALFLFGVLSITRTGYYGGELVFKHAAGVEFTSGLDFGAAADTTLIENPSVTDSKENED